jgi:hypothetical protein
MTHIDCVGSGEGRAQSSTIGVVLLFGLVVAGTTMVVLVGATAVTDSQQQSDIDRATQELTLFDSRAAMVALGDSEVQTVRLNGGGGGYDVHNDSGYIKVTNTNYIDDATRRTEVLFNETLGALVYDVGDREIAYQGGGVWQRGENGGATMISSPEFHYRDATLTLPVIRVNNTDSASGSIAATVEKSQQTRRVFPNSSTDYSAGDQSYRNPIRNGTVNITVHSDYYLGWAEYFSERTDGDITIFDGNDTVRLTLATVSGAVGDFDMPLEGESLEIQGMANAHSISEFDMTLRHDGSRGFNNMHWAWYVENPDEKFELHFYSDSKCKGKKGFDGDIDASIYYYNDTGPTTVEEEWQNTDLSGSDYSVDCADGTLSLDLIPASSSMVYDDISLTGSDNKWMLGPEISDHTVSGPTTSFDDGADTGNYTVGDSENMGFLINHYLNKLAPSYDLRVTDGPGGSSRVNEGSSFGTLNYGLTTGDQYLTFLHVTENSIDIDID